MRVQRAAYFYATVRDQPGEAYRLLSRLADAGVHLLAFSAIPVGGEQTQIMLFPQSPERLAEAAERFNFELSGPEHALLCRGDDGLGAFADIHRQLADADINVYSSSGVTADCGRFGYVLYVRSDQFEDAARALGI